MDFEEDEERDIIYQYCLLDVVKEKVKNLLSKFFV
jgi:hypothetical protein